ncbi:radical SAM protein [Aliarcobacter cryaerophilus]|uniref:radical SAM/SPASM domain-containing protein n=1 Tax=Aliarcobacter cryaerophilus TaxID=28198 RepID=UPI0021B6985E|nr:radical SAM/SPASM domain-containing protein [Aliarcobacter cryaerophilus]MCT7509566.1 radical SAM protein [Aliarcobacter cryaerophilus]
MKAEIKPRIELENRTKLETVIPLSTPFVIFVDPADSCNFKCSFCPTGDTELMKKVGRPFKVMNFELYKKIINDICEFDKPIKVLRLYKDGEPLLNKKLPEMIKYAKDKGCAQKIDTTTNASLLTHETSLKLIEAGLDRINISIEGVNKEQYKSFSKVDIDFEKLVENIKFFYENKKQCEVLVKINGDTLSENEKQLFLDTFGNHCDKIFIEHIMSCWPEFDIKEVKVNNEFGIYGQEIKEVSVCPYPFYSFSINSDGSASTCFLDWSRKLIIGDAKNQSVKSIWFGNEMQTYYKMFLEARRKEHPVCKDCGQLTHGMPDNIDDYKEQLLKKMNF